ncbi:MAG: hypothetical protein KUG65_06765 [Sphingomonadaceae bacterium]|nr:hypothetical protein [Sphingomonadaceae bacterium]
MLLKLVVPTIQNKLERVRIDGLGVVVGDKVSPGAKLLEFTSGLDQAAMHDCPPITSYRMTSSETAWVRQLVAREGEDAMSGDLLALLSTDPDESLEGAESRLARNAIAAIFKPVAW